MIEFCLKNIDTKFPCYKQFINLIDFLKQYSYETIRINLSDWFGANMSAVLGGVLDKYATTNQIEIVSQNSNVISILQRNGFLSNYGYRNARDINNTTVKYMKIKSTENRFFSMYVLDELLSKSAFPHMTTSLKQKITESIYEIFVNAKMHSNSDYIYTCGQFYPTKHVIEFTIVDMGQGIRNTVVNRFNKNLTATQAIQWAIGEGNTTKIGVPGGHGLSILKDFIKLNKGRMQIISDSGFYEFGENEQIMSFTNPFKGTIVNMKFRTNDTNSYSLDNEIDINEIF